MKDIDARATNLMSAASAGARAPSGRISAAAASRGDGSLAGAFEILFRRMKEHTPMASPESGNSPATRTPDAPGGLSPPRARDGAFLSVRTGGTAEAAPTVAAATGPGAGPPLIARDLEPAMPASGTGDVATANGPGVGPPLIARDLEPAMPASGTGDAAVSVAGDGPQRFAFAAAQREMLTRDAIIPQPVAPGPSGSAEVPVPGAMTEIPAPEIAVKAQAIGVIAEAEGQRIGPVPELEGIVGRLPIDSAVIAVAEAAPVGETHAAPKLQVRHARIPVPTAQSFVMTEEAAPSAVQTAAPSRAAFSFANLLEGGEPDGNANPGPGVLPETLLPDAFARAMAEQPPNRVAAPVAAVGGGRLIDGLVQGVQMAQRGEATEVVVQLKPEFLGKLSIRVLADDHGMRVEIRAESEMVRQVMQDNLADLQQRLSEKGLAFDQMNVSAETGEHSRKEQAQWARAPAIGREAEPEIAANVVAQPAPLSVSGKIDYLA